MIASNEWVSMNAWWRGSSREGAMPTRSPSLSADIEPLALVEAPPEEGPCPPTLVKASPKEALIAPTYAST